MAGFFQVDAATRMASVQLWVMMTTGFLVLRFILDFSGPLYNDMVMLFTVGTVEAMNYNMVHYTLGLMQLSAARVNDYFQVWAVLMVTLQYSVKVGRPYSRAQKIPLLDIMSSLWTANLLRVQTFLLLKIPLWLIWSLNAARIVVDYFATDRATTMNEENAKLLSDYMRYEHELSAAGDVDPVTMRGYKYLVFGEGQQEMSPQLDVTHHKLITVEKLWRLHGSRLLGDAADSDNRFKDVCLSFALYKLLRRRFYDLPIHEAVQSKTRRLIFEGILQDNKNYERAFRITEVELSFLHDFFYSKHASMFTGGLPFWRLLLSVMLATTTGYIAYPVRYIPQRMDQADHNRITHGVVVTRCIVALIVAKELLEIIIYVFSQWTKVLMICKYVENPRLRRPMRCAVRLMFRIITRGRWDHKICQYNILISPRQPHPLNRSKLFRKSIPLKAEVTKKIFQSLKDVQNDKTLESYLSSAFGSNQDLMRNIKKTSDELDADTHRIMVWHIATCLCEINLYGEGKALKIFSLRKCVIRPFVEESRIPRGGAGPVWEHYITAASLSNYCAYLLSKALVPDNGLMADKVFREVVREARSATRRCESLKDIYDSLERVAEQSAPEGKSLIKIGAELGVQLMLAYAEDKAGLWAGLGKFWAGFLLHLAASTKAAKYKTHLAGGGELVTHLWALLSHAGFLGLRRTSHGHQQGDPLDVSVDDRLNQT